MNHPRLHNGTTVRQGVPQPSNANYHNLECCIQRETIAKWSEKLVTDIKINYV